jgi:hypothetical protein
MAKPESCIKTLKVEAVYFGLIASRRRRFSKPISRASSSTTQSAVRWVGAWPGARGRYPKVRVSAITGMPFAVALKSVSALHRIPHASSFPKTGAAQYACAPPNNLLDRFGEGQGHHSPLVT